VSRSEAGTLPEYPATVLAAIRAAEVGGRLPSPSAQTLGDIFPFEPDLTVVPVREPMYPEPPRNGEHGPADCFICGKPTSDYLWSDRSWRVVPFPEPLGVHAVLLEPHAHVDLGELPDALAAELGPLLVWIDRALRQALDGVARVHVNRWGDGGAHLHWWFIARPAGLLQLRGSALATWLDVLPPLSEAERQAGLRRIAAALNSSD
jgi:diadenosine tetraphosphate (Ap4A) HIT family hydrolase